MPQCLESLSCTKPAYARNLVSVFTLQFNLTLFHSSLERLTSRFWADLAPSSNIFNMWQRSCAASINRFSAKHVISLSNSSGLLYSFSSTVNSLNSGVEINLTQWSEYVCLELRPCDFTCAHCTVRPCEAKFTDGVGIFVTPVSDGLCACLM